MDADPRLDDDRLARVAAAAWLRRDAARDVRVNQCRKEQMQRAAQVAFAHYKSLCSVQKEVSELNLV